MIDHQRHPGNQHWPQCQGVPQRLTSAVGLVDRVDLALGLG